MTATEIYDQENKDQEQQYAQAEHYSLFEIEFQKVILILFFFHSFYNFDRAINMVFAIILIMISIC